MIDRPVEERERAIVLHPILIALYPLVSIYTTNVGLMSPREILRPAAIVLVGTLAVGAAAWLLTRNIRTAGYLTSLFLILFFGFERAVEALQWADPVLDLGDRRRTVLAAGCMLVLAACWIVRRWQVPRWPTVFLNIAAAIATILQLGTLAVRSAALAGDQPLMTAAPDDGRTGGRERPDIYYIVLDGYGRSDVLRDLYRYDNSWFLDDLRQKGFYVAEDSAANYCQTLLSLAASMNMTYLDSLSQRVGIGSHDRATLRNAVVDNALARQLQEHGYRVITFSSGYVATELKHADLRLSSPFTLTEYQNLLIGLTPLPAVLHRIGWQFAAHRWGVSYVFDELPAVEDRETPLFVFAHVMSPHPPFVFGPNGTKVIQTKRFTLFDGNFLIENQADVEEYRRGYADQLAFVSQQILRVLQRIILRSPGALIVVQGDHGPGSQLDWVRPDRTNMRERLAILNAYRVPEPVRAKLYRRISPVNSFRLILNHLFDTVLEPLPDRSYYSRWDTPYDFIDVSAVVNPRSGTSMP
jgi:hypothetical protein